MNNQKDNPTNPDDNTECRNPLVESQPDNHSWENTMGETAETGADTGTPVRHLTLLGDAAGLCDDCSEQERIRRCIEQSQLWLGEALYPSDWAD